jgi:hypothetical protein
MLNKICWQSNSWCCNCSSLVNSFALAFSDGVSVAKLWSSHGRPTLICFIALTRLVGSEFGSPFIKNGGFWFTKELGLKPRPNASGTATPRGRLGVILNLGKKHLQ